MAARLTKNTVAEEGANTCASGRRNHRVAPVSKDGAATWFETPRTRLRNLGTSKSRLLTMRPKETASASK
jgi:hypothetical protein